MTFYIIVFSGILIIYWFSQKKKTVKERQSSLVAEAASDEEPDEIPEWTEPQTDFPQQWRFVLDRKVGFYTNLTADEKNLFEYKVAEFLANHRITGVQTEINDEDRLLVASSAIIPVFRFPEWYYSNLYEVLIYPDAFDEKFRVTGRGRNILGMVGTGYMDGKMILSKPALHHGFDNETDKRNTGVHEFIHLIDKMDNVIDGIPAVLMEKQYALPWIAQIEKKVAEIYANRSDINPYGATSQIEFFAVISEYFFESPKLLQQKHPELYEILQEVFDHDMALRKLDRRRYAIGRNDPCPCGSGDKFKKCCGSVHYR